MIENVAGVVDPTSLKEFKLAVTSSQHTKALVLAYNIIEELSAKVEELSSAKPKVTRKPTTTEA